MSMLDSNIKILTGWCAVSKEAERTIFPQVAQHMFLIPHAITEWETLMAQLEASRLIRYWRKNREGLQSATLNSSSLAFSDTHVFWENQTIGCVQTFYKATLPHETQARIAYEIFFDRFSAYLTAQYKITVLTQSDLHLELFIPINQTVGVNEMWQTFTAHVFSGQALQESFVNLVNTIKLTERGFSALSVPIVSEEQALYLSAFYLANINSLQRGDRNRRYQIDTLQQELEIAEGKEIERKQKSITKLQKELTIRLERYAPYYDQVKTLTKTYPEKMRRMDNIARKMFHRQAGTQIGKSGSKIGKCIQEMTNMLALTDADYFQLPALITNQPQNYIARAGGDSNTKLCYACGNILQRGESVYSANKFIFESPSQRLQSAAGQTQPKICGTCAAISFVSPIKVGNGRLVVRMRPQSDPLNPVKETRYFPHRVDEQLRMLTMGELNIVAGKYVIMQASEMVGQKPVYDQLGGEQYALYKVGTSFPSQVFRAFEIEAVIDGADVVLNGRFLTLIHYLSSIFNVRRGNWNDKKKFAAFGRAIRHIQKDNLIFAIYELATSGILSIDKGWSPEKSAALEDLCKEHVEWLKMSKPDFAQQYKDIAAMSAMLYAFLDAVNRKLNGDRNKQRIEIRKIIERAEEPEQVTYSIAPYLVDGNNPISAFLKRRADTYFGYDQLSEFITKLPSEFADRWEDKDSVRLTLDDLNNAYAYLYSERYTTEKEKREFAYKLRLSLASRFPQHYQTKGSDKE